MAMAMDEWHVFLAAGGKGPFLDNWICKSLGNFDRRGPYKVGTLLRHGGIRFNESARVPEIGTTNCGRRGLFSGRVI